MTSELGSAPFPNWPPDTPHEDGSGRAEERRLHRELAEQTRLTTELAGKLALASRRERELRELLLDAHDQLLRRDDELQAALAVALDGRDPPAPAGRAGQSMAHLEYRRVILKIRGVVEATVPEGALVAVVSKGDDELLDFAGRRGVHFPQASDGTYAGHHPADSASAINLVESARASGAQFLLFPATASWWLSHYTELTHHLDSRYSRVVDDGACVVFALSTPPDATADIATDYPALVVRLREAVHADLPTDATVLVVSRGDEELLNLYGRRAWHFPQDAEGRYAGHYPPDGEAAIDELEQLHNRGASHLVFPATALWWLAHYDRFRKHLVDRYTTLIDRDDTCVVFELGPVKGTRFRRSFLNRLSRH